MSKHCSRTVVESFFLSLWLWLWHLQPFMIARDGPILCDCPILSTAVYNLLCRTMYDPWRRPSLYIRPTFYNMTAHKHLTLSMAIMESILYLIVGKFRDTNWRAPWRSGLSDDFCPEFYFSPHELWFLILCKKRPCEVFFSDFRLFFEIFALSYSINRIICVLHEKI